jgi:hypothetical protein
MAKEIIFDNADKHKRAVDAVALATGKREPINSREADLQLYWAGEIEGIKGDPIQHVYEALGGLVITRADVEKRAANKAAIKAKKGGKK